MDTITFVVEDLEDIGTAMVYRATCPQEPGLEGHGITQWNAIAMLCENIQERHDFIHLAKRMLEGLHK